MRISRFCATHLGFFFNFLFLCGNRLFLRDDFSLISHVKIFFFKKDFLFLKFFLKSSLKETIETISHIKNEILENVCWKYDFFYNIFKNS